jgi:hypothetical protein
MAVAAPALRERYGDNARVDGFAFLFPGVSTHGRAVTFPVEIVPGGLLVIDALCRLAAAGAFPATDDGDDCTWCDYRAACRAVNRNLDDLHAATKRKMRNRDNDKLSAFVELRIDH